MSGFVLAALTAALTVMPQQAERPSLTEQEADLVLTATVRFDTLRVEANATPAVEFTGTLIDRTEWSAERINMPDKLEPGVTYTNGGIRLRILATFKNADALLEALLEDR